MTRIDVRPAMENPKMTTSKSFRIDAPLDPQQVDETDMPWSLLNEARDPSVIREGALVIVGDVEDPLVARVVDFVELGHVTKVHFEILGNAYEVADLLESARHTSA